MQSGGSLGPVWVKASTSVWIGSLLLNLFQKIYETRKGHTEDFKSSSLDLKLGAWFKNVIFLLWLYHNRLHEFCCVYQFSIIKVMHSKYGSKKKIRLRRLKTGTLYQLRGVGWEGKWEAGSKGRGYMYTYGWFMLKFDRKQQNSVKQLSFNKK